MASTQKFEIDASLRHDMGKGASRRLRRQEQVPAVVYGGDKAPTLLSLEHKLIARALENEAFYSHILTLKTGSESDHVILKDVQRHPYKPRIMHVDFQRIKANEKIHMHVPLHFINEDKAPGVKAGGIISHIMTDVEIHCLPANLPEYIEVDLSSVELNQTVHLSNLNVPAGVELNALAHGDDRSVASIHLPRAQEEIEIPTEAPVASEVPATAQKSENGDK